jgi:peptidoglycan/LPS O-acetylase OafA/YrhL
LSLLYGETSGLMFGSEIKTMSGPPAIDYTDWLKTAAIILVFVDHTGYFFIENNEWWSTFGRLAAPLFFFLLGYGQTRTVPLNWIWLGIILTLLDSWNTDWAWVAPNILISLALIRIGRPYVQTFVQNYRWPALALLVLILIVALPLTADLVDYGAEGWLWALLGLCQRLYVDSRSVTGGASAAHGQASSSQVLTKHLGAMRLLACFAAASVYVWQEQREFLFSPVNFAVFVLGIGALSLSLCLFQRGPSRVQPPEPIAGAMRFIGRHTLEIYAIQLAGSELIVGLVPDPDLDALETVAGAGFRAPGIIAAIYFIFS